MLATGYLRLPSSCAGLPASPRHDVQPPCFIRPLTIHPHSFLGDRLLCIACICPASSVTGPTVWKLGERESARSDSTRPIDHRPEGTRPETLHEEGNFEWTGKLERGAGLLLRFREIFGRIRSMQTIRCRLFHAN